MISKTRTPGTDRLRWRNTLLAATLALAVAGQAFPQSASSNGGNAAKGLNDEGEYSTWDIGGFFGTQWFQLYQETQNQVHDFETRPILGGRIGEDFGRYFGLEEDFGVGFNRLALLPYGQTAYATVGERNYQITGLGMVYLKPRTSAFRPYLEFGPSMVIYQPSSAGSMQLPSNGLPVTAPASLNTKIEPGFVYGAGIKMPLTHRLSTQIDVRGLYTPTPDFGLPSSPSYPGQIWIDNERRGANAFQFTVGLNYRLGFHEPPPPVAAAPPPPPQAHIMVGEIQGAHAVCPGDNLQLSVRASGWLPNQTPNYQWYVDGREIPGATGTTFNMPTADGSGEKQVTVKVSVPDNSATSQPAGVMIRTAAPPTVSFNVSPSTIAYGQKVPLSATATGSACTDPVTVRYTASEGTITGDTFDSTGMSFDLSNRLKQQSKTVTLTAIATDAKRETARATADVTVNLKPEAARKDIVFANRSARVNNAAKRYLIEELTPRLRDDPNSTVILIGHRDTSETGRAAAKLDEERVLNAAAVLSAGKGVCPSLDLSRVQVKYDGTDQTDPPMPFGDSSVKERRGQSATDQRAEFRRVEVWFIPGGADKPDISGLMPAPVSAIQAKGCPK